MNNFLQSIIDRDPAAKSKLSMFLTYPEIKAVFFPLPWSMVESS